MAVVTGRLRDFGFSTPEGARIKFIPEAAGLSVGNVVLSARPVYATPDLAGDFSVNLFSYEDMLVAVGYRIVLEGFVDGEYLLWADFPDWLLYVPSEGGIFPDLVRMPMPACLVWVGEEAPLKPSPGSGWVDTSDGSEYSVPYYEWEA